jgi:hypothetical protein
MRLAQQLESIGCDVDRDGSDWLTAADLTPPVTPAVAQSSRPGVGQRLETLSDSDIEFTTSTGKWDMKIDNLSVDRSGSQTVVRGEITSREQGDLTVTLRAVFYAGNRNLGSASSLVFNLIADDFRAFDITNYDKLGPFTKVRVQIDSAH